MSIAPVIHDQPLASARLRRRSRRLALAGTVALVAAAGVSAALWLRTQREQTVAVAAAGLPYAPHAVVVGYPGTATSLLTEIRRLARVAVTLSPQPSPTPHEQLLELPRAADVPAVAAAVRRLPGVTYAVPDYLAHIAGSWYPNDTGRSGKDKGWEALQWNFLSRHGVNAPEGWANLIADHRPGAKGIVIAVVDTGVAFRDWETFKRSPDLKGTKFVDPCDLVAHPLRAGRCVDQYALDRESHGTFVASTIAEATNNHFGLTGLAYGASIMPVRVLDAEGNGDSSTIAAGIRYAVQHGAQVINLSIEFSPGTTSSQIPDVASAVTYAHDHGVVLVGASGNDEDNSVDFPAALPAVISVGATTSDGCLAVYSDVGRRLDLMAPGGGNDAAAVSGSVCHPSRNLPDIYQMTFDDPSHPALFSLPGGWFGTSMAAPAVSAAAAMVIASGVLGPHPTPAAVLDRLEATARPLGSGSPNSDYGYGLVDIGAATRRNGPMKPPPVSPYALKGAAGSVTRVSRSSRTDGSGAR